MQEIWVTYNDGIMGTVYQSELQQLIDRDKIVKFHRADGWVYLGVDPVRSTDNSEYDGPERRKKQKKSKAIYENNSLALADFNDLINW